MQKRVNKGVNLMDINMTPAGIYRGSIANWTAKYLAYKFSSSTLYNSPSKKAKKKQMCSEAVEVIPLKGAVNQEAISSQTGSSFI